MKRILSFILIIGILFMIVSCNKLEKIELQQLIDEDIQNKNVYTTASYKDYISALNNARSVRKNPFSSARDITKAQDELQSAISKLEVATHGIYQINYHFSMISNDSIGNDWIKKVSFNGQEFNSGDTISAPLNSNAVINAYIIENDNVSDVGFGTIEIKLNDGESGYTEITVRENRGRYAGNKAIWKLECSITIIEQK